jgi:hypothetical protein
LFLFDIKEKYFRESVTFLRYQRIACPFCNKKMKNRNDIIKDLEDQILPRLQQIKTLQGEVDTLQRSAAALRELDGGTLLPAKENSQDGSLADYPGYPMSGILLDKYRYLEDRTLKVWRKKDMEDLILKIEGKRHAAKTLKSARQTTAYYIKNRRLISLRYANKNKYGFFTTRSEWVERNDEDGKISFHLIAQHEPEQSLLVGLSEEDRKSNSITWSGIN